MRAIFSAWLISVSILTSAASAQTVGQTYRDRIQLETSIASKIQVPLPEGDWLVVAKDFGRSTVSNVRRYRIRLVQVSDRVLKGYIFIGTNDELANYGWTIPDYCTRTNTFYREPVDTRGFSAERGYDCLVINHVQMTSGSKASTGVQAFYDWVWKNTTGMPTTMIASSFLISDGKRYVEAVYHRNPEAEGFAAPRDSAWRSSDWHKDRLPADPKKLAYMESIKLWAVHWRPLVEDGFHGRLPERITTDR